jgi:hypothetical protein
MSKRAVLTVLTALLPAVVYGVGPQYRTDKTGTYFRCVDSSNPVIYDNDVFDDIIDYDYLLCKASLGQVKLVGIIGTPVRPDGVCIENWWRGSEGPFLKYEAARESGLRMDRIPRPLKGATSMLERPADGVIEHTKFESNDGSNLIVREAMKATPEKPLLLYIGGQSPTVATAYLKDNRIAERVMVFYTDGSAYNSGHNKWSAYIVFKRLPSVNIGKSFWFKETSKKSQCDWHVLPTPGRAVDTGDTCSKDEWSLFPDEPLARQKGVLNTLRNNGHYNGAWNIGHWDGPLDGFWIGVYAPTWWNNGFKRFKVEWSGDGWRWKETMSEDYDLVDELKMSYEGERSAHDELLRTWIDPRCYQNKASKK